MNQQSSPSTEITNLLRINFSLDDRSYCVALNRWHASSYLLSRFPYSAFPKLWHVGRHSVTPLFDDAASLTLYRYESGAPPFFIAEAMTFKSRRDSWSTAVALLRARDRLFDTFEFNAVLGTRRGLVSDMIFEVSLMWPEFSRKIGQDHHISLEFEDLGKQPDSRYRRIARYELRQGWRCTEPSHARIKELEDRILYLENHSGVTVWNCGGEKHWKSC